MKGSAFKSWQKSDKVIKDAPVLHLLAYASGGLRRLYHLIKTDLVPDLSEYGANTTDDGQFDPKGECVIGLRYRVKEILDAAGQTAVVVLAEDLYNRDSDVVIKILHANFYPFGAQESSILQRLARADPLNHSHTLRMITSLTHDDHYCLVFEPLVPCPLTEVFSDIPRSQVLADIRVVGLRLLAALGFLRQQNLIHTDLKPDNILFKRARDLDSVHIVDFGNALNYVHSEVSLYYKDFRLQTPLYRAPEVMFGLPFGPEIDVWSLGCILGELYLGRPIFMGSSQQEILTQIVKVLGPFPASTLAMMDHLHCGDVMFANLITGLLTYKAEERLTASENTIPAQGLDSSIYPYSPAVAYSTKKRQLSPLELLRLGTVELPPFDHKSTVVKPLPNRRIGGFKHDDGYGNNSISNSIDEDNEKKRIGGNDLSAVRNMAHGIESGKFSDSVKKQMSKLLDAIKQEQDLVEDDFNRRDDSGRGARIETHGKGVVRPCPKYGEVSFIEVEKSTRDDTDMLKDFRHENISKKESHYETKGARQMGYDDDPGKNIPIRNYQKTAFVSPMRNDSPCERNLQLGRNNTGFNAKNLVHVSGQDERILHHPTHNLTAGRKSSTCVKEIHPARKRRASEVFLNQNSDEEYVDLLSPVTIKHGGKMAKRYNSGNNIESESRQLLRKKRGIIVHSYKSQVSEKSVHGHHGEDFMTKYQENESLSIERPNKKLRSGTMSSHSQFHDNSFQDDFPSTASESEDNDSRIRRHRRAEQDKNVSENETVKNNTSGIVGRVTGSRIANEDKVSGSWSVNEEKASGNWSVNEERATGLMIANEEKVSGSWNVNEEKASGNRIRAIGISNADEVRTSGNRVNVSWNANEEKTTGNVHEGKTSGSSNVKEISAVGNRNINEGKAAGNRNAKDRATANWKVYERRETSKRNVNERIAIGIVNYDAGRTADNRSANEGIAIGNVNYNAGRTADNRSVNEGIAIGNVNYDAGRTADNSNAHEGRATIYKNVNGGRKVNRVTSGVGVYEERVGRCRHVNGRNNIDGRATGSHIVDNTEEELPTPIRVDKSYLEGNTNMSESPEIVYSVQDESHEDKSMVESAPRNKRARSFNVKVNINGGMTVGSYNRKSKEDDRKIVEETEMYGKEMKQKLESNKNNPRDQFSFTGTPLTELKSLRKYGGIAERIEQQRSKNRKGARKSLPFDVSPNKEKTELSGITYINLVDDLDAAEQRVVPTTENSDYELESDIGSVSDYEESGVLENSASSWNTQQPVRSHKVNRSQSRSNVEDSQTCNVRDGADAKLIKDGGQPKVVMGKSKVVMGKSKSLCGIGRALSGNGKVQGANGKVLT
ncbi:YAK1-like protein, partial [Mya arenaria]